MLGWRGEVLFFNCSSSQQVGCEVLISSLLTVLRHSSEEGKDGHPNVIGVPNNTHFRDVWSSMLSEPPCEMVIIFPLHK